MRTLLRTSGMHASAVGLVSAALLTLGFASCQSSHQPTRRTEVSLEPGYPQGNNFFHQASYRPVRAQVPTVAGAEMVNDDEICQQCHEAYVKSFREANVHRNEGCEGCHGPSSKHVETRGKEPGLIISFKTGDPAVRAEACLRCHADNQCAAGERWRTSKHAQCGVSCVECHRGHHEVPPGTKATTEPNETAATTRGQVSPAAYASAADQPKTKLPSLRGTSNNMGAVAPGTCFRCHQDMAIYQQIAGPHQICGPNGFNCTTCHDPHGNIIEYSRKELCLSCHGNGAPVMAWHSSIHQLNNVACTDCHNPHPPACVPRTVNISHTDVRRPERRTMSVQEPEVCYKCHQKIYGLTSLPSHHPIKEGKMVCSDCHDSHGQYERGLKQETVNLVCYKCHADKQGPFVYEHPPVTENCAYCHEPHGTVANNLLRQPTTFLCLRCHAGHRNGPAFHDAPYLPDFAGPTAANGGRHQQLQAAFFTDCTQCHSQIHGSDVPTPHRPRVMQR